MWSPAANLCENLWPGVSTLKPKSLQTRDEVERAVGGEAGSGVGLVLHQAYQGIEITEGKFSVQIKDVVKGSPSCQAKNAGKLRYTLDPKPSIPHSQPMVLCTLEVRSHCHKLRRKRNLNQDTTSPPRRINPT